MVLTVDSKSVNKLKDELLSSFNDKLSSLSNLQVGYMEKNSKRWLECDQDIDAMYKDFKVREEILLWCDGMSDISQGGRKRKNTGGEPPSKRGVCKEGTIEEITKELQEKHGETWSNPQYRLWARMVHNDQHRSLDVPPSIPMFSGTRYTSKPHQRESLTDAITSAATAVAGILKGNAPVEATPQPPGALSPGKRSRVSGQYLEHLEKLSHLHTSGVLSDIEQKKFALKNIRQLNE